MAARRSDGNIATNLVHFARVLRSSGLPIGTGKVLCAIEAMRSVGVDSRTDLYWTLHAVFVNHPRQRMIFDQAFAVFWKNPRLLEKTMAALLPEVRVPYNTEHSKELAKRLSESLYPGLQPDAPNLDCEEQIELQAALTYSDRERLQQVDFESMTRAEMEQAKQVIQKMKTAFAPVRTRRFRIHSGGERLDVRNTVKRSLRGSGGQFMLIRQKRQMRHSPLVILCDISGSMSEYSKMVLYFSHTLMTSRRDVWCFVFGTRLTNISRQLQVRDVDVALDAVSDTVTDWHGGTRIAECLKNFNHIWVRRLPLHIATVLLVTDGLDRSQRVDLEPQVSRLHCACKQLTWLNPLLRYAQFEPKVSGIRKILPHVDAFVPVHNLNSLQAMADSLTANVRSGRAGQTRQHADWVRQIKRAQGAEPMAAAGA